MPLGHQYELNILNSIGFTDFDIEPIWIKLNTHNYKTWPQGYVDKFYISYDEVKDQQALDGFIITGAPIEHLNFEEVTYWNEIVKIINDARDRFPSTLGLCWAGMAMAYLLGVKKVLYETKLFGVFELENKVPNHPIMGATDDKFFCPQSRNAGMDNQDIEKAEIRGDLTALAFSEETGYPIYETPDHKQIVHLGHPEYNSSRLAYEAKRDSDDPNVPPITNFDFANPSNVWKMHRHTFFHQWIKFCYEKSRLKI
tara:strand:+ start:7127 stop:7891 length:765 start_codon:yes stop_codon:yes gene_type:complete